MFSSKPNQKARGLTIGLIAAASIALTGCSGINGSNSNGDSAADSVVFTLATGAQADSAHAAVQNRFLDRVEEVTAGRISFERTATEALCKMAEVADCVRDGRAQIGVSVPDYTPQYFPSTSMVSIPFLSQDSQAVMQSIYEMHRDYEPAKAIMDRNGLHHVATWPVGRFLLGGHQKIENSDQLKGMQVRASGPIMQQVLRDTGANIVAVTAPESYEAVERGVVNSVGGSIDFPVSYKLMELLPEWVDPGVGEYSTFGMWVNAEAYASLSDELRALFDSAVEELNSGSGMETFDASVDTMCQEMKDSSTVKDLASWDEQSSEAWEKAVGDSGRQKWIDLATEQGLDDADKVLSEYIKGLERNSGDKVRDSTLNCVTSFADR